MNYILFHIHSYQSMSYIEWISLNTIKKATSAKEYENAPTLAAGMPHFCAGIFRSWGRDTFISLKGTLLVNKRFDEAKKIILLYARAIDPLTGLVPNLLGDAANGAKYNSRDAVWWWLNAICDFCEAAESEEILKSKVILNMSIDKSNRFLY